MYTKMYIKNSTKSIQNVCLIYIYTKMYTKVCTKT